MIWRSNLLPLALAGLVAGAVTSRAARPVLAQQPDTLTGCLAKSTAKDTFNIRTKDGKAHPVTSKTVQLGQHVGHTVTVTGTPVTKLSMVSPSCK